MTDVDGQFSWRAHPARERKVAALAAIAVIVAFAGGVLLAFESVPFCVISAIVFFVALNRFFLPSRFVIDQTGISAFYPLKRQRYEWSRIRRFVHDRYGVYLSTRNQASRLDAFRGMNILFGEDRQAVTDHVRQRVGEFRST